LSSIIDEHRIDNCLVLKDSVPNLQACRCQMSKNGTEFTHNFVSAFLCPRTDVGGIKYTVKEWDLPIIKEPRPNVSFSLVLGVAREVTLHVCECCSADGISKAHYPAVSLHAM
jgi:hypothetical protein